jgi:predicted enzyme related to lactoylglutathione lyase
MGKKMDKDTNAINWFEIPVSNIDRAKKFYEAIFDITMTTGEMPEYKMVFFPSIVAGGKVGGALAQSKMHHPGPTGVLIYLNANPDLQDVASRIELAGGKIILPKTMISPENGFMAFFTDTEGNTVGLHSNN